MLGAGQLPVFTGAIAAPHKAATAEYGAYILSYHDCRTCHGPISPLACPDRSVVKDWKLEEFIATLRTGVDTNGHKLDGNLMPGVRSA